MRDWNKELQEIFEDPLLADVKPAQKRVKSSDRLVAGFQQIVEFVEANGRCPQNSEDRLERTLYNQLHGILNDSEKIERCRPFDTVGLLSKVLDEPQAAYGSGVKTEDDELSDIFNDPIFTEEQEEGSSIFDLPDYMKKKLVERKEADYVAKREKCEDFSMFEAGFKEIHRGLKSGKYRLIKFKDAHVEQGRYFIEDGMLVYVAALGQVEMNRHGKKDCRTRCIYENGTESGIFMQTLCKNIYTTGYTVQDTSELEVDYLNDAFSVESSDVQSGIIYVLRSLSTDPEISSIRDLYKIGFTTTPVEARIANAKNEPTYLCADVDIVATWRIYNVKSSVFESLIHKLFANAQLQITIDGVTPKEWFIVPFPVIEQAVNYIVQGKPIAYDHSIQQIVLLAE